MKFIVIAVAVVAALIGAEIWRQNHAEKHALWIAGNKRVPEGAEIR